MNPSVSAAERLARIRLNAFLFFRADWLERLIEIFGSAEEILRQDAQTLSQEANLNLSTANHLLQAAFALDPQEEWDKTAALGGHIFVPEDEEYPQSLKTSKKPRSLSMYWANFPRRNKPAWGWWARAKLPLTAAAWQQNWREI